MRMAILLAALALAGCNDPAPAARPEATVAAAPKLNVIDRSHAGTPAPTIKFENVGRKPVSLADYRGKKLLVNLWATWCAPCLAEMPQIDTLAATRGDALAVLPISQDMEGWRHAACRCRSCMTKRARKSGVSPAPPTGRPLRRKA